MDNKVTLPITILFTLVLTGCGDGRTPAAPGGCTAIPCDDGGAAGTGGVGAIGGAGGIGGASVGCFDDVECELDAVCVVEEYDGVSLPSDIGDLAEMPGVCVTLPPQMRLSIVTFAPMRFVSDEGNRDPKVDDYETEEGEFSITSSYSSFRFDEGPTPWGPWELPYRSPPLRYFYTWQGEFTLHADDIECNLVFGSGGAVIAGGIVREPGKVLCSNNNWLPPQFPDAPGLLVEYEVLSSP